MGGQKSPSRLSYPGDYGTALCHVILYSFYNNSGSLRT
jgi:hypothetical protein